MPGTFKVVGDFWFNVTDLTLWRGQEYIQLTPKAGAILRELLTHPGQILTHQQLLQAVWPKTYVQPEVLKVHIFELRRALGDDPKRPRYIETIPRRGHRLIASVQDAEPSPLGGGPPGAPELLVGRSQAMEKLKAAFQTASQGKRQLVFVTGEPGVGKTALIEAFLAKLGSISSTLVARARCVQIDVGPKLYDAILEILRVLSRSVSVEIYAPTWHALLAQAASPEPMLGEIGDFLEAITLRTALVIVIEDIHWADPGTVDVLSAIALRGGPGNLMVICSFRPAELILSKPSVWALVSELRLKKLCSEIALEPLEEARLRDLLAEKLPDAVIPDNLSRVLAENSGGNPLLVSVILSHLHESGKLRVRDGVWTLADKKDDLDLPESIQDLLLSRFAFLSPDQRRLMEDAALLGPTFSAWELAVVSEMPEAEVEAECEALAARGGILRSAGIKRLSRGVEVARFEFRLKLYSAALARRVEPARRIRAHRRVAERMEALGDEMTQEQVEEVAWHYEQSRDFEKAISYLEWAATQELRRHGPLEAAALFGHAGDLVSRIAHGERREEIQLRILGETARSLSASGELDHALDIWQELIDLAVSRGHQELAVGAALESGQIRMIVNYRRAVQMSEWALTESEKLDNSFLVARAQLESNHLRLALQRWKPDYLAQAESAFARLRAQMPPEETASVDAVYASIQNLRSNYEGALSLATAAVETARTRNIALTEQFADQVLRYSLLYLGRWGELHKRTEGALTLAEQSGDPLNTHLLRIDRVMLLLECSNFDQALQELESIAGQKMSKYRYYAHQIAAMRALAYAGSGKYELALEAAAEFPHRSGEPRYAPHWVMIDRATVEAQLGLADLEGALETAERLLSVVLKSEERTWQALGWYCLARVHRLRGQMTRAKYAIDSGLHLVQSFDVPLAAWRVYSVACQIYSDQKQPREASAFSLKASAAIARLASPFAGEASLHETFLKAAIRESALTQNISGENDVSLIEDQDPA